MTLPRRLLISGVPGAGKSFFVDWLATVRGFFVLKADELPVLFRAIWSAARSGSQTAVKASLIPVVHRRVAIEVGFVPAEPEFTAVRTLIAAGFDGWWFAAEHTEAFRGWCQAWPGGDARAFHRQVERISSHWPAIESLYPGRIIQTVRGGQRMSPEDIASIIGESVK